MTKTPTKTKLDPKSGQEAPAKPVASKKAETQAKFDEADAKADPKADELDAIQMGQQIRGY